MGLSSETVEKLAKARHPIDILAKLDVDVENFHQVA